MKKNSYVVIGGGPFACELLCYLRLQDKPRKCHVISDDLYDHDFIKDYDIDLKIHKNVQEFVDFIKNDSTHMNVYLGSGKPQVKMRMFKEIKDYLNDSINIGDPLALENSSLLSLKIGKGTILAPNSVVAPMCKIGDNVLINYGASIGHHCNIKDFVCIGPNASIGGVCTIGEGAYIGSGACIREKITIGKGAIIGMGAVVTSDVPDNITVVGVPAKKTKLKGGWK